MVALTENQVKKDMLFSFLLAIISTALYTATIFSVFNLEFTNSFGKIAMLIISFGFLFALYLSTKTFGKRLSSLKLLMVDQDE